MQEGDHLKRKVCLIFSLLALLIGFEPASAATIGEVLNRSHIFTHCSLAVLGRQALITVYSPGDESSRRKQAVAAARLLVNNAPAQFTTIFVRYYDNAGAVSYCEVIVNTRDITSLSVGTARLDDILSQLSVIYAQSGESAAQIFDKYLGAAEKQMDLGNFWEAEQIVDAASATHGTPADTNTSSRFTRDMLNLADSFDCWGDPDRAERILRRLLEHRSSVGNLADLDGDRSVQHLFDLLMANKRYQDAETFLQTMLGNPSLAADCQPALYAANLERMALCHGRMGRNEQSAGEFAQAISILQSHGGEYSSRLARCLEEMADSLASQGKSADARASLLRARSIYDHAIVSRSPAERIDYQLYSAHVKQIEEKLKRL